MPERELRRGGPSGSAMPLVWAHSEHIKLLRSLRDGAVFDMPPQGVKRYIEDRTVSPLRTWRFNNKIRAIQRQAFGFRDEEYLRLKILTCMLPKL